jgi:hypothetical protein
MTSTPTNQIEFTIQTLDGTQHTVSIFKTDAKHFYDENNIYHNKYAKYGLDYLKEAISKKCGVAIYSQELIYSSEIVTISTPLVDMDKVITLIINPPFYVSIKEECTQVDGNLVYRMMYPIYLYRGARGLLSPHDLGLSKNDTSNSIPLIEVIGLDRDLFRVEIANLPKDNIFLDCSEQLISVYTPKPDDPKYGWLKYNSNCMEMRPSN